MDRSPVAATGAVGPRDFSPVGPRLDARRARLRRSPAMSHSSVRRCSWTLCLLLAACGDNSGDEGDETTGTTVPATDASTGTSTGGTTEITTDPTTGGTTDATTGGTNDGTTDAPTTGSACPTYEDFGKPFIDAYCIRCHSETKVGPDRNGAPPGRDFDTLELVLPQAEKMILFAGAPAPDDINTFMPIGEPKPTDAERTQLAEWLTCEGG
jgi:hypothetical protein